MEVNFTVTEFVLLGFHELPGFQLVLFFIFLVIYVATLVGNSLTTGLFCLDRHFHSPMYILLCNMSVLDMSFTSTVLPKLLDICLTGNNIISFNGCITQVFFSVVLIGVLDGILYAILISSCTFCKSNEIDHLFYDLKPLMMISCSDTHTIERVILGLGTIVGFVPSVMTLVSYMYIISTVLRIHSKEGRHKTFSTCSSHLTIILLFYGTILGMYMRPKSSYSMEQDKVFAILYSGVIPMLNPFIYSLKNQEVKKVQNKETYASIIFRLLMMKQLFFLSSCTDS